MATTMIYFELIKCFYQPIPYIVMLPQKLSSNGFLAAITNLQQQTENATDS